MVTLGVLLIDGGGSLRKAPIDAEMALLAEDNEEGIVVYGYVREVDELGKRQRT